MYFLTYVLSVSDVLNEVFHQNVAYVAMAIHACFKCFICFLHMLQVFHLYVSKVDLGEHMLQKHGASAWVTVCVGYLN
jgi:predicted nucleic acid-binding protein